MIQLKFSKVCGKHPSIDQAGNQSITQSFSYLFEHQLKVYIKCKSASNAIQYTKCIFYNGLIYSGVRVTRSLVVCFVDRCLSFFFWPLCCLSFIDIRILITPFTSSNSSYGGNRRLIKNGSKSDTFGKIYLTMKHIEKKYPSEKDFLISK